MLDQLTKSCPAVVALTSSGAMYSIVPQNENARYICIHSTQNAVALNRWWWWWWCAM